MSTSEIRIPPAVADTPAGQAQGRIRNAYARLWVAVPFGVA